MQKEINYKDYHFIIDVQLNTNVERHPGGKCFSTIVISNQTGSRTYYKVRKVENKFLKKEIEEFEKDMREFVDNNDVVPEEVQILLDLGFK